MPKKKFDKEFKINAVKLVKEQGLSVSLDGVIDIKVNYYFFHHDNLHI